MTTENMSHPYIRGGLSTSSPLSRRRLAIFALILPCCVLIAVSALVIAVVPLRRFAPLLGRSTGTGIGRTIASTAQLRRAWVVGDAIAIAARRVPFRSDCYPQALAAMVLCAMLSIPTALHFGARIEPDGKTMRLAGHVWVTTAAMPICGGLPGADEFASVACFLRGRPDPAPVVKLVGTAGDFGAVR